MSSGNARADWRRRCVIHGEGCQYRLCKPKTRTACTLKRLLDRLACLKGFVRAQLADAKLSEWWLEGMPENTTGWAYDTWLYERMIRLLSHLAGTVELLFPQLAAANLGRSFVQRGCMLLKDGRCQFRSLTQRKKTGPLPPHQVCDQENVANYLQCAMSTLRFASQQLFDVRTAHGTKPAVAAFKAVIHSLQEGTYQARDALQRKPKPDARTGPKAKVTKGAHLSSLRKVEGRKSKAKAREKPPTTQSTTASQSSSRKWDPRALDMGALGGVTPVDLKSLEPMEQVTAGVMSAYIALLKFHGDHEDDALCLCDPTLVDLLRGDERRRAIVDNAVPILKPGRVTCIPYLQGAHWSLCIVDQFSDPPQVLQADSNDNGRIKAMPKELRVYLRNHLPGWNGTVHNAHSPQQIKTKTEDNNSGLHTLQNMEFVARWYLWEPERIRDLWSRLDEDGVQVTCMVKHRITMRELMERLIACRGDEHALRREAKKMTLFLALKYRRQTPTSSPAPPPARQDATVVGGPNPKPKERAGSPPTSQKTRSSRAWDPRAIDLGALGGVLRADLKTLKPKEEVTERVMSAYIAILKVHRGKNDGLGLCDPAFEAHLRGTAHQRAVAGNSVPILKPGRVTCIPINRGGYHWALYIVDQASDPAAPQVFQADSMDNGRIKEMPTELSQYLKLHLPAWKGRVRLARSPQQMKGSNDCGLHTLQNMDLVSRHYWNREGMRDWDLTAMFEEEGIEAERMAQYRIDMVKVMESLIACRGDGNALLMEAENNEPFLAIPQQ